MKDSTQPIVPQVSVRSDYTVTSGQWDITKTHENWYKIREQHHGVSPGLSRKDLEELRAAIDTVLKIAT
jgi:hypothetical protein